ncbi:hypothetical protein AB0P07_01310 [Streptomyces sp. NPDC085944]|uniref:hypothetical protein n=1 Tax=Streptomyces sp. NPDC085944 TaxID=3154962 RepID=UPI003436C8B1
MNAAPAFLGDGGWGMAEQGDRPLRASDAPSTESGASGAESPAAGGSPAPSGGAPPGERAPAPSVEGAEDYTGLLAVLGRHLDRHAPDEVVVLLRAELDRREAAAYASGWQDAAAQYEPALAEARAAGGRTLRLVRGTPGQAAVIPLRQEGTQRTGRDPADGHGHGHESDGGAESGKRSGSAPHPDPDDGRQPAAPPALVPKSPSSRAPTIPKLRTNRRRPAGGGRAGTPGGDAL